MICKAGHTTQMKAARIKLFKKEAYFLLDLGYENLWYILYPHLRHELLNERKRDRIYKDVLGFHRR